jgi:hypothetical protein
LTPRVNLHLQQRHKVSAKELAARKDKEAFGQAVAPCYPAACLRNSLRNQRASIFINARGGGNAGNASEVTFGRATSPHTLLVAPFLERPQTANSSHSDHIWRWRNGVPKRDTSPAMTGSAPCAHSLGVRFIGS